MISISLSALTSMKVDAASYSYTAVQSSSSEWSNYKTTTKTSYTPITKSTKTVTTKRFYTGRIWYTGVKSTTDNYKHVKGNNDVTASNTKSISHTFNCSVSGEAAGFGGSLGYSKSVTSSKTVSQAIPKNAATGYYYHGVKAKVRDLKVVTEVNKYKKKTVNKRTNYYWNSWSKSTNTAVRLYTPGGRSALYYAWYKA